MKLTKINSLIFLAFCLFSGFYSCTETNESPSANSTNAPTMTVPAANNSSTLNKLPVKEDIPRDTLPAIDFDENYLMGKFNPAKHTDFTKIKRTHASREGMFIRKDTYKAFQKMYEAAKKDSVFLKIISATRPFDRQKTIWEAKWTGARKVDGKDLSKTIPFGKDRALKILNFSSMPGSSRHHWGTDIDLNNLTNEYFTKGTGLKIYNWLDKNAADFGFAQVYTPKGPARPDGYNEEKWHWTYQPVALQLTRACREMLTNDMINGFKGDEQATEIDVVNKYILGINKDCL